MQTSVYSFHLLFCDEFKPTSMDKNRPGYFHKRKKDTMVHMEFQNNQQGKPNVVFQGIVEDYKENGAILLFDGHTFRMEQLHHAVNKLRHVCRSGELHTASVGPSLQSHLEPVGNAASYPQFPSKDATEVEVERMGIGDAESLGMALS
ncbi:hypothetical protein SAY87_007478 [Trapa incisa]|uniref:Transcription elongation factor Eaf N-terminal domain-containing protein n=1 Tax=Trapa incisa TaxID=236973 RepID=A0AAN7KF37_9MYRT|nr:hypothetical protein SAY87_007478 [Trapa incisa]